MKIKAKLIVVFMFLGMASVFAQDIKKEEFKVYGNCGMCETRIEDAATSIDGVTSAKWNSKTEMIKVTYDASKTDLDKIHQAIADVGHDTDLKKADDKTYDNLHGCCKYDRPEKEEE